MSNLRSLLESSRRTRNASNFAARFLAQQKASDASDTVDYAELKAQVHEHRVRGALRQQAAATLRNAAAKARLSRVEQEFMDQWLLEAKSLREEVWLLEHQLGLDCDERDDSLSSVAIDDVRTQVTELCQAAAESQYRSTAIREAVRTSWSRHQDNCETLEREMRSVLRDCVRDASLLLGPSAVPASLCSLVCLPPHPPPMGVPASLSNADVPDDNLWMFLCDAFAQLDSTFALRLADLEADAEETSADTLPFTEEEHILYLILHDSLSGRPLTTLLHRLTAQMPNRRHCDLIALTQFHHHRHHLQIRARALVQQWRAARAQAETRALAMVAEAQRIREEGRATDAARQAFEQLKRRHRAHHEQARREHEERRAREEEERTREREREQQRMERAALLEEKRRGKAREALVQRRSQMILQQRAQQELHEARERKRASEKARQGRENAQRVAFRQERLRETRARAAVEEAERTAAKREREERLQALRDTVTVSIESDPTRVFAPTAASRARTTTTEPEALSLSEPFQDPQRLPTSHALHSYTSDQVLRDPRVRLEMLLRRANVQDTPYARSVLASVKGCQQPRRDMYSQIFKQ